MKSQFHLILIVIAVVVIMSSIVPKSAATQLWRPMLRKSSHPLQHLFRRPSLAPSWFNHGRSALEPTLLSALSVFKEMDRDMDRMFNDVWSSWPLQESSSMMGISDYKDTDEATVISIDVPGIGQENLKVSLKDSLLTVEGKQEEHVEKRRPSQKGKEGEETVKVEEGELESEVRSVRQIKEQFAVDKDNYDLDQIKVSMKNGVLTLHLSKIKKAEEPAQEGARQLNIESE